VLLVKVLASAMALGSFEALERSVAKELTAVGGRVKELAAQYGGVPAAELDWLHAKEEGDLADLAAEIEQLGARAATAQGAALTAAEAFGGAAAGLAVVVVLSRR
jgi:hypothetical protein